MTKRTCSFDECGNPHEAQGLCNGHYLQQKRGQELRPLRPNTRCLTLEQRFWAKVQKTPDCWEWTAALISPNRYGAFRVAGQTCPAHRVAWELTNGPIPKGMFLDHRCHNKRCVNPAHLRLVTKSENGQHRSGPQSNNTSGVRGVTWDKKRNAWIAQAQLHGRHYHGGYYSTIELADAAARALRKELFTHDDHDQWLTDPGLRKSDP